MSEETDMARDRRWLPPLLELAAAWFVTLAFFATCYLIKIRPVDRMGQVAILASVTYRFVLFAVPLVVSLIAVAKYRPAWWSWAERLVCASLAGLGSATIAGAMLAMLRETAYGLAADTGDPVVLAKWALELQNGKLETTFYPPLQIYLLSWMSRIQGLEPIFAIKSFQILSVLMFGPMVYAAWRLLLRPLWALGLGLVVALPLLEPYRLLPLLVLAMFVPVVIKFVEMLRRAPELEPRALAVRGAAMGVGFALLFLMYSGWFQWSAPGLIITAAVVFPWRRGPRRGVILLAAALIPFLAINSTYLLDIVQSPPLRDNFYYFDAQVEPMYVAMWRGGLPGPIGAFWPPMGELGGVGLFSVALYAGWAAAIALGARTSAVIATSWMMVGAWSIRLYYAHKMWRTKLVQLYPRTTAEIVYCLTVLTGFAVYLYVERRRERACAASTAVASDSSAIPAAPACAPWTTIGALCGLALLLVSSASAIADRYMPRKTDGDLGRLAYVALVAGGPGHTKTFDATVDVSSQVEQIERAPLRIVDQILQTEYHSALSPTADHEEWITIHLARAGKFSRVVLVPARGGGFPVDFTIEVWDSLRWLPRVVKQDFHPTKGPQSFTWGSSDFTNTIRVRVTKLGAIGDQFGLRLSEIEIYE